MKWEDEVIFNRIYSIYSMFYVFYILCFMLSIYVLCDKHYVVLYSILCSNILYSNVSHFSVLHSSVPCSKILHFNVLCSNILLF